MSRFTEVTCFHRPTGPAQISGGSLGDWRTIAITPASRVDEAWLTDSSSLQSCWTTPALGTDRKPDLPWMFSPNVMGSGAVQVRDDGEALMLPVKFRPFPPPMETTNTSPPVEPSSLISPSMKATFLPSGET